MSISLELIDSFPKIEKDIYKALAVQINQIMRKKVQRNTRELKDNIKKWMMQSEEIKSLLSQGIPGSLNATFGLTPGSPEDAVKAIVSEIAEAITIDFKRVSNTLEGGVTFNFQSTDFVNLLGLPQGHQFSEAGTDLHWLDWLITKGDSVIVKGYLYQPSNSGRSGGGTMDIGGVFRVPPQYSGTADNNFVTRAFSGRDKELARILTSFLE